MYKIPPMGHGLFNDLIMLHYARALKSVKKSLRFQWIFQRSNWLQLTCRTALSWRCSKQKFISQGRSLGGSLQWVQFRFSLFSLSHWNCSIFFLRNKLKNFHFDKKNKSKWFLFPTQFAPWKSYWTSTRMDSY